MQDEILKQNFTNINDKFIGIDKRFDKIDEKFIEVDKRFDKIGEKFIDVDENFTAIKQDFNRMDERFNQQDNWLQEIARNMALVLEIVRDNDSVWQFSEKRIVDHERRISKLERQAT